ncbi:MAG: MBL fold metallo-hydrolase [Chloroflexi bacterium]|nr:MBL fold metallo-hydrolase [Chloroflexota bacterium]MCY3939098.1 MBL fold metallo-hydrolase [Chloroflexota bacterium]
MEIAWYGGSCFRLRDRNTIALADPYLPDSKFQNLQIKTDLITVSQPNLDRRNIVPNVRKSPYVIDGPGEYEVGGIFVNAVWNGSNNGRTNGAPPGLICTFAIDGVAICHLGQLEAPLSKELLELITPVDVLIIPPGGRGKLGRVQAARIVSATSPKVVIPMEYASGEHEDGGGIDAFIREAGLEAGEPVNAVNLSRSNLPDDKTETVLLESRTRLKKPAGARSLAQ